MALLVSGRPVAGGRCRRPSGIVKLKTDWDLEEVALVAEALASATDRDGAMVVAAPGLPTGSDARRRQRRPCRQTTPVERPDDARADSGRPCRAGDARETCESRLQLLRPSDVTGGRNTGAVEPVPTDAALGCWPIWRHTTGPSPCRPTGRAAVAPRATRDNVAGPQRKPL